MDTHNDITYIMHQEWKVKSRNDRKKNKPNGNVLWIIWFSWCDIKWIIWLPIGHYCLFCVINCVIILWALIQQLYKFRKFNHFENTFFCACKNTSLLRLRIVGHRYDMAQTILKYFSLLQEKTILCVYLHSKNKC
jgi:hypothetical protein